MPETVETLVIDPEGRLTFLWSDELVGLLECGRPRIRRVSHVDPTEDGRWTADLAPVDGPTLGPFTTRGEAVDAEREWLLERWMGLGE